MMSETFRTFLALPVSAELSETLARAQRALEPFWPPGAIRWARRDQFHLTLKFFGDVAAEQLPGLTEAVRRASAESPPLALRLTELGGFPSPRQPRVLWVGLGGDVERLLELQPGLAAATAPYGDHAEAREFHPHLTLGRVGGRDARGVRPRRDDWAATTLGEPRAWRANAIQLLRSQLDPAGARYTELACLPLIGTRIP